MLLVADADRTASWGGWMPPGSCPKQVNCFESPLITQLWLVPKKIAVELTDDGAMHVGPNFTVSMQPPQHEGRLTFPFGSIAQIEFSPTDNVVDARFGREICSIWALVGNWTSSVPSPKQRKWVRREAWVHVVQSKMIGKSMHTVSRWRRPAKAIGWIEWDGANGESSRDWVLKTLKMRE